jgi:hypothetical protein
VAAVDISGNESALSPLGSAIPLAGTPPVLEVAASIPSGRIGDLATLTASGAESYDFDLDGDGTFEVSGDTSGSALIDTSQTGLIRPAVRGSSGGGNSVAYGAVSLIIMAGIPPVAELTFDITE